MSLLTRLKTPIFQNTGSTARDHLANERTFLAWTRTGLGFIALGIAVERFSQLDIEALLRPPSSPPTKDREGIKEDEKGKGKEQLLVSGLLGTGTGSIVYGTARYFSNLRLLERGGFKPAFHDVGVLSVAVAALAGAAWWNTLQLGVRKESERERNELGRRKRGEGRGREKV